MRRCEVRAAAAIVRANYSRKYELLAREELKAMFSRGGPRPVYCVAIDKGEIIGFAGYIQSWMDYNVYQIFWVNVLPSRQGQGIGRKLMTRVIMEIQKKKEAYLVLITADGKKLLPSWYEGWFGFKTLREFGPQYHLMALELRIPAGAGHRAAVSASARAAIR